MKKDEILNLRAVGYWSALGGLEVKDVKYGLDDVVYVVSGAWTNNKKAHILTIKTTPNGRYFITLKGARFFFDECLKV